MPYFGYSNSDADSMTLMAAGALGDLTGEGWSYYNAADAPEGAWNYFGSTDKTATLTLPATMTAGTWYIFLKMIDYDQHRTVYYTLGADTSDTITTDDRDTNGTWTSRATLAVVTPGNTLIVHIGNNAGSATSHMFKGIYMTTNANITVLATDIAVNLNYPTIMDDSAAVKGNLIPNGGFECGVDGMAWGFQAQGGGRTVPTTGMWDGTQGWEGAACLKVIMTSATRLVPSSTTESLISRVFHLKSNKTYTASCYAKSSADTSPNVTIRVVNTFIPPAGYTGQYSIASSATAINSSTWTRVSVTGYLLAYPTCDYNIFIDTSGGDDTYVLIDGVQLEEGSLSAFAPAATMEAGIIIDQSSKAGNVYYSTDTLQATLKARNHTGSPQTQILHFVIYDYMNRIVREGIYNLTSIAANTTYSDSSFDISTGNKFGCFRLITWIENLANTEREIVYSVIPQPTSGVDTASYMGIHPNFYPPQLDALKRLGIKWARDLSPQMIARWTVAEPTDDSFVFFDARITDLLAADITPMLCLGYLWPAWADSSGVPNLTKWAEFCTQMVAHYSPSVKYWEIWNEPPFTDAFYAQLLKAAYDAIHAQDATAKVIGMGGVTDTHMNGIISAIESTYPAWNWEADLYAVSTHDYVGGESPEDLTDIINTYGIRMWNTETGIWDKGFYQGPACGFVTWGKSIWPHTDAQYFYRGCVRPSELVKNFVRTIGSGQTNYFYYDSRYYADPTFFGEHTSIWEQDGSIRSKGIAYALTGSLIDKATTLGQVNPDANSHGWVFDTGNDPVACLFSTDFAPRRITLSGVSYFQIEVLDMMRNPIPISGLDVPYGRIPIWIRGKGITASTLSAAISGGTVTTRSDTAAPFCVIQNAPQGPINSGDAFRVRFVGIDDTSYPNLGEINVETLAPADEPNPEAILYSYRLKPYEAWSSWSARTIVDYAGVPDGYYSFQVKAKDVAGNESTVTERRLTVGTFNRPQRVLLKH